ncbi:adenosine deaminase, partial [Lacticaseibacillus paracasei subsp. paracasei Lpp41]
QQLDFLVIHLNAIDAAFIPDVDKKSLRDQLHQDYATYC